MFAYLRLGRHYTIFCAATITLFINSEVVMMMTTTSENVPENDSCVYSLQHSSDEFPEDIFSQEQRLHGAIFVHLFVLMYCFVLIAMVCQDYFLPSVFCICEDLKITPDIAAATFMASATSFPEMSVNVIATFVTKSDLGIGTIVGSTVCNTLAVAGIAGLMTRKNVKLEPKPLFRDSIIHLCVITVLGLVLMDGIIEWIDAFVLVVLYFIYFVAMLTHKLIISFFRKNIFTCFLVPSTYVFEVNEAKIDTISEHMDARTHVVNEIESGQVNEDKPTLLILWSCFTHPVRKILYITIPDCKSNTRLYPATFAMCVIWIGICSYLLCWMVTIFGDTFNIPDVVMGMIFLAIGGSIPEASSATINARNGIGTMSVSNTLGANTLDILLSLGMPWLIKCSLPEEYGGGPIMLETDNLPFDCIGLASGIVLLNLIAYATGYNMNRSFGILCVLSYFVIVTIFITAGLHIVTAKGTTNYTC